MRRKIIGTRTRRRRLFARGAAASAIGAACLASGATSVSAGAGSRTPPPRTAGGPRPPTAGPSHSGVRVVRALPARTTTTTHFLYVEDGTVPTDSVDVFSVSGTTLTFLQHMSVGMAGGGGEHFGAHRLAVTKATSTRPACLVFASPADGALYTFAIARNHTFSGPVSAVAVGGSPEDLAISGNTVFESNPARGTIDVLSIASSACSVTLLHQSSTGSENDASLALLSGTEVVSTDTSSGDMVVYHLGSGGVMTEIAKGPGQIAGPASVAVLKASTPGGAVTNVYTGQVSRDPAQAQGFQLSGKTFGPLFASPQTNTGTGLPLNGASVAIDAAHLLLLQAYDRLGGQIGWYNITVGVPGFPGSIAFGGETTSAQAGDTPQGLTVLGSVLFVGPASGSDDLQACALATSGVSGCVTVATLTPNNAGQGGPVAIL